MNTISIKAYPTEDNQIEALKAFLKALKIKFEEATDNKPYDKNFVNKIQKSKEEFKAGKSVRVKKDNLKNLLGL